MRLQLISFALCAAALAAPAQTIENPLPLQPGANSYTFPANNDVMTYYLFSSDSDQEVTITSEIRSFYLDHAELSDGQPPVFDNTTYNWFYDSSTVNKFVATAGKQYLIRIWTESTTEKPGDTMNFQLSTTPRSHLLNLTCNNPLQLTAQPQLLTLFGRDSQGNMSAPSYAAYTPTEDCQLEIITDWYPWYMQYATDCDASEWTDIPILTASSELGSYRWMFEAKKDTPYIFRTSGAYCTMIWAIESHYDKGLTCEMPFDAHVGLNRLPAKAGTYYYTLQAPQIDKEAPDNFIEIKSSANLKGGSVSLMDKCDGEAPYTVCDNFALRTQVLSRQTCIIMVVKPEDTPSDEVFEIKFNQPQPYDDIYNPYAIVSGVPMTTPEFPGTYFYLVEPVHEEGMVLTVESDYKVKSLTEVYLSEASYLHSYVATGETGLRYTELKPDTDYILLWYTEDADCSVPFTVNVTKGLKGETPVNPLDAVAGRNEMSPSPMQYWQFTATAEGYLNINTADGCPEPSVKMARNDGYNPRCTVFPVEGGYRVLSAPGRVFTLSFADVPAGASFTLEEKPFGEGESFSTAKEVEGGNFTTPAAPGIWWYKFTPEEDLYTSIITSLRHGFGEGGLEGLRATYTLYRNDLSDYLLPEADWTTGNIPPLDFIAYGGDTYYLEIVTIDNAGATFHIESAPTLPGDTPSKAIVIENQGDPTNFTFPQRDYSQTNATWYSIHLYEGELKMAANGTIKVEVYPLGSYDRDDMLTDSGYLSYDSDTDVMYYGFGFDNSYYPAVNVAQEGDFILKLRWCDGVDATFSGSALSDKGGVESVSADSDTIAVTAVSGGIELSGYGHASIYSVDGICIGSLEVNGHASALLAPGIYIVNTGSTSAKISVK